MNSFIEPIAEFVIRLFSKSPKFFRVIQWLIAAITILLSAMTALSDNGLFVAPEWINQYLGGNSILMGVLAYIIAKLPVDSTIQKDAKVNKLLNK